MARLLLSFRSFLDASYAADHGIYVILNEVKNLIAVSGFSVRFFTSFNMTLCFSENRWIFNEMFHFVQHDTVGRWFQCHPVIVSRTQRIGQYLDQMPRAPPSAVGDLLAAAGAHRHHLGRGRERADGWEQRTLADRLRDRVMLGLVAERAGHSAAAAIDLVHLAAGDHAQQRQRVRRADQCLLMAVAV